MRYIKKHKKKIIGLIAIGLVLIAGYTFSQSGTSQNKNTSLGNELVQNSIILDSLGFIEVASPRSAEQHKVIAQKLGQNLENLVKLGNSSKSEEYKSQVEQITKNELETLNTYNRNIDALYKVLTYNPTEDLASVNPDELKSRANAAKNGINSVLDKRIAQNEVSLSPDSIKLSDNAHSSLQKSKNCFERLSQGLTKSSECSENYTQTRKNLNTELQNLWQTDAAEDLKASLQNLLAQINSAQ